jgi:hypothetical protein
LAQQANDLSGCQPHTKFNAGKKGYYSDLTRPFWPESKGSSSSSSSSSSSRIERSLINVLGWLGLQVDWPDESRSFFTREEDGEFVQVAAVVQQQKWGEEGTVK